MHILKQLTSFSILQYQYHPWIKSESGIPTLAFLAAASALTCAGVFRALLGLTGPLARPPLLAVEDTLRASSSAIPWSLVTLRALFIRSPFGVLTRKRREGLAR